MRVRVAGTGEEGVGLRAAPSTSAERLKAIAEGAILQVIGPDRQAEGRVWRNVREPDGLDGWVAGDFLDPVPPDATASPVAEGPAAATPTRPSAAPPSPVAAVGPVRVIATGGEGASLRAAPATSAERLKVIAEGAILQVIGPDRQAEGRVWRNVREPDGLDGWVVGDFLGPPPVP
jgi:SH3-like domain-containing protein